MSWRTVRIREDAYRHLRELAQRERKSMCEIVSTIISRFAEGMKSGINVGDHAGLSAEAKTALSVLISEIDEIIRSSMNAEEKVERVMALLYTWIVANKLPIWEVRREDSLRVLAEVTNNEQSRKTPQN